MLDDSDFDIPEDDSPKPSGNRRFVTIVGILGTILVLALIAMAIYALVILPQQQAAETEQPSAAQLTSAAEAKAIQATSTATASPTLTRTPTNTSAPNTETPTETPVTPIFTSGAGPATQTVQSLLTQAAVAQTEAASTILTFTPTATIGDLPDAGFADDVGLPGLLIATGVLLLVILAARRLRTAVG